ALQSLNTVGTNIMTAEDPVEFNLPGVNQVQMKEQIGLNFAAALRSFLRQDPNIVLVGEVRDFETAEIAIKAALTAHLLLSTLLPPRSPTHPHERCTFDVPPPHEHGHRTVSGRYEREPDSGSATNPARLQGLPERKSHAC